MESINGLDLNLILLSLPKITLPPLMAVALLLLSALWLYPGGPAWALSRPGRPIPGPRGFVLALSGTSAHTVLCELAHSLKATGLMAFSVGFTRFVVSSSPESAKEILNSSAFADRPVKESAYELMFHRAMGFAPFGEYWRNLRRVSAAHLFSPRRMAAFSESRRAIGARMVEEVRGASVNASGVVRVKGLVQFGSLNNVMVSVFGKGVEFGSDEGLELEAMVREGYELLGVFNYGDHFPLLRWMDIHGVRRRCRSLVGRVDVFVGRIIEEHRRRRRRGGEGHVGDFVDVLLDLEEDAKLSHSDMVSVLWVSPEKIKEKDSYMF